MNSYKISDKAKDFLETLKGSAFINDAWLKSSIDDKLSILDPNTEEVLTELACADAELVDKAVEAAKQAFKSTTWNKMPVANREKLLLDLADRIESEHKIIAEILMLESGKLFDQACSEVLSAAKTFRYYAGWATKIEGETIDISLKQAPGKQNFAFTRREPVGVVAVIVPWNFPISIASWKMAPLLAAGCTCVLKPSEVCPLSTMYFIELFSKCGFPKGVVNLTVGDGNTGSSLTTHKSIDKITFTGSTQVGQIIGKAAMENLTDISLELGGKSPALVFEDADLQDAAKAVAMGIFRNSGQVCVAGSRVYIQESIFDTFVDMLADIAHKMKISDSHDTNADIGPLASSEQLNRVQSFISGAEGELQLACGGRRLSRKGYFIEPTIFKARDHSNIISREEVFGPVLVAIPFKHTDEALKLANDSPYGLSSTVWTSSISTAMKCVEELNAGWVFVNSVARSDPNFPIGGNKMSGIGRELGKTGLYTFTKLKSVNIVY